ncbi:MAG TPA: ATP-binding protein [Chthoniobacteraceae bacterium]|nr:ATP-binding protein [Chthoniobacteraceae bacterium]
MRFGELIPLIGALVNFSLAVFVLYHNPRALVSRVYFFLGICFAIWNYGTFWMFRMDPGDHDGALFWARFLQFGVIWIPLMLCHISFLIAQIPVPRWLVRTLYGLHAVIFLMNFTSFYVADVRRASYAWYAVAGTGFWLWSAVFSLVWVSIVVLFRFRRTLPANARRRVTPLLVAQTALVTFGGNDILPILGIYTYPGTHYPIYPFGSMAVILYGVIVGYSVLQYQLLDVRVTMSRTAAKAIRMMFIFLTGLCALLILWLIHPEGFTMYSFFAALATLMIGATCAATLFPRLFGDSSETIERKLLGDTFEYEDQVRRFVESITWYSDVNLLFNDLDDLLTRVFDLASYFLILRDDTNRMFEVTRSHPAHSPVQCPELKPQSPVFQYFEWSQGEYLPLDSNDVYTRRSPLARQAREQLASFHSRFCFPLSSEGETFGLLLVGDKSHGRFSASDITLLLTVVKSMSLIVNQIRLKTQILRAQELDLLGKMSRGMAHDLNNLLTPVWTLLQLSNELGGELDEELLPMALRNVTTMRAYIREALFFSENLRPDLQLGRLDLVVRNAIEVARTSRKKEISVIAIAPGEVLAEMDEVLIQRLLANLIVNAIDASPEGEEVQVFLERLPKVDPTREWLRVRVVDRGEGIPKENLSRILTPYFTTKNRGDENRGFGLGLAICRKIVTLHGGNLAISSQIRKGTTVQVDLPSRQLKPAIPAIKTAAAS